MKDQSHIPATLPVPVQGKAHVPEHGIGPTFRHPVHRLPEIDQARNRTVGDPMVHRHDDRFSGVPVNDTFQTNFFPSHNIIPLFLHASRSSKFAGMDQVKYQYQVKKRRYAFGEDGAASFIFDTIKVLMPGAGASLSPVKTLTGEKTLTLHGYSIGNRKYIKQWTGQKLVISGFS
jgi:hypothetical protein